MPKYGKKDYEKGLLLYNTYFYLVKLNPANTAGGKNEGRWSILIKRSIIYFCGKYCQSKNTYLYIEMSDEKIHKTHYLPGEPNLYHTAMQGMKLRIYHSFEEAEGDASANDAKQSPLERIRETVELILRVYGVTQQQLNERKRNLHINIISYQ